MSWVTVFFKQIVRNDMSSHDNAGGVLIESRERVRYARDAFSARVSVIIPTGNVVNNIKKKEPTEVSN